jgi:hypothetical protein
MVMREVTTMPPIDRHSTHLDVTEKVTWLLHGLS